MSDFHVVKVLPRGRVIVDASDLRRVVIRGTREVLADLLPQKLAEIVAQTFRETGGGDAIVVPYLASKRSRRRVVR
ncbi:MAG TPA: hypothetical protein VFG14_12800 [Chthoniobacteraceae bacterium]|nr:hypothetical protein [Chthoniobacteraceae bacterium]